MNVGVVTEAKTDENRVALTPAGAETLIGDGHEVLVQSGAGVGSQFLDDEYAAAGAKIIDGAASVWAESDIIVKVKEPQESEFAHLRSGQILFTYLHLAAYPKVANALMKTGVTAIAYETVVMPDRSIPLLAPMSEVAGRMAPQVGARMLEKYAGGRGILLGGIPGVAPATVIVVGAGMAGSNAAQIAAGMGADVTVFDVNPVPLRRLDSVYRGALKTRIGSPADIKAAAREADLVIGAVLLPGKRAPRILDTADIGEMREGSALVDIAIDQGGCFETSRETKHSDPTYVVDGVVHYAVGNIPGAVPRTSTFGLTNVTLPYLRLLADHDVEGAVARRPELEGGINVADGEIVHAAVAEALA
ncbi:MAG: alanine dehydrogenase [Acidimicrobiia bacterium]|nr:alanine dehydrogenase [Acidimicrobiia bacterium]NND14054.1 alanine dehydrogenase [Acidimicrobiia bacterium]NNL48594.1 alanine dehydrogenase [Acidimicrobiia bacterium]